VYGRSSQLGDLLFWEKSYAGVCGELHPVMHSLGLKRLDHRSIFACDKTFDAGARRIAGGGGDVRQEVPTVG